MRLLYKLYAASFVLAGLFGVLGAHADPSVGLALGHPMLAQVRYLRVVELGFGVLMWRSVDPFFNDRATNTALVGVLVCIPLGRTLSLMLDGVPWPGFGWQLLLEYGATVALGWHTRALWGASRQQA